MRARPWFLLVLSLAGTAHAGDRFCEGIRQIVEARRGGFEGLVVTNRVPSLDCKVERDGDPVVVHCTQRVEQGSRDDTERLLNQVDACLPGWNRVPGSLAPPEDARDLDRFALVSSSGGETIDFLAKSSFDMDHGTGGTIAWRWTTFTVRAPRR